MITLSRSATALHGIGAPDPVELHDIGGARLAVKRWGSGLPVLCLHAVGHGGGDFQALAERIGNEFEVIALDWPGQGRSPADGGAVRAARYARLLLAACDTLGLAHPIVIGNSIGGTAALMAAAESPQRFSAIVLCNAGGLSAVDGAARFVTGRMAALFAAGDRGAAWFPAAFAAYYRALVLTAAPARQRRRLIVAAARELAPLLAEAWRGFAEPAADLRDLPARVTVPVWLAWAKGDRFVSWGRAKAAAAGFPRQRITLLRGSHAAFIEDPDAFAAGFSTFAADVRHGRL